MTTLAWHFMADRDGKPILRDGRPAPEVGEWLVHEGPIQMCASGLHASLDPRDALRDAPGPWVARVECDEVEYELNDKFVCRRRKILWMADATPVLHWFARRCALDVIHMWDAPPVVVRYLRTGDESLREAAMDAAGDTRDAASYAAMAALKAAMSDATEKARAAMNDAAWDSALASAKARQSRRLGRGLMTLTGGKR